MTNSPLIHNTDGHEGVELTSSPGSRLRIARQTKRLEIPSIASQLHLHPDKIEALEQDRYADLAGSVFVSGYIRNYARLLDLDPEPLLAAYQAADPNAVPIPKRVVNTTAAPRREARSNDLVVRLISLAIVLGIAGLFAMWWMNRSGPLFDPTLLDEPSAPAEAVATIDALPVDPPPMDEPLTEQAPAQTAVVSPVAPTPATEQATPSPSAEQAPELMPEQTPDQQTAVPPQTEAADEASRQQVESAAETQPEPEPAAAIVAEPDAAVAADASGSTEPTPAGETEEAPPAASAAIVLEFTGPCWVDVRDSSRTFKLFGEKNAGDRFVLEGTPPYDFVLGNASAVTIEVNGEPFDLASHSKGNVARFKLELDDAL